MSDEIVYTHRTRSGLKARILATNIVGKYPVVAVVLHGDNVERLVEMYRDLTTSLNTLSPLDLFEHNPWLDVAVDTPVWVCQTFNHDTWVKRHFARFENGSIYVWEDGKTSWTTSHMAAYKFAKLVTR